MIRRSSNHWKLWVVLFPIIGTCALANFQGPGGMRFFQAWWGDAVPISVNGLITWIDASKSSSVTLNGTNVAAIADLSAMNQSITQTNTASQPIYEIASRNGLNTIRFIESNQHFFNYTSNNIPSSYSVFKVIQRPAAFTHSAFIGNNLSAPNERYTMFWYSFDNNIYNKASPTVVNHGNNVSTGWFYVASIRNSTNSMTFRINGTNFNTTTSGAGVTSESSGYWNLIGSANDGVSIRYSQGNLAELIVYNRSLNTSEVNDVETYLKNKWGF